MLPKTLAALSTFFVAVAVHASEPVGAARIQEQVWQESGVHAREFVVKGIKGGAEVVWRVSPRPAGMLVRQFPGAHRVLIAGPAGSYTLTAEVWTAKIAKLPAGWKEGDDVPITLSAETVTATFTLGTPGPTPPVPPDPLPPGPGPTPPDPQPPPGPVAPVKFVVVVVEETGDAAIARGQFFASGPLNERMTERGHRWRVVDKDVVGPDGRPPADVLRFLVDAGKRGYPAVYLVNEKGRAVYSGPVPKTAAELLALITKWGG